MVKKNQPQSYEEILKYLGEMSDDHKKWRRTETTGQDTPRCRNDFRHGADRIRNRPDKKEARGS